MDFSRDKKNNYFQQKFSGVSLTKKTIKSREFEECVFNKCSFIECRFEKCKFINCSFIDCNLSAIKPTNSSFMEVKFKNSKAVGFDWTKARDVRFLEFDNCKIDYSNFSFLKLPKLELINSQAKEVDFIETDLTDGRFKGTDFKKARFHKSNLTRADFRKTYNYSIDFRHNILKKAKFTLPEANNLLKCLDIILEEN